ncbi:SH3 domain [Trinorchestia longiramus]|nr:SH3 domain [Trinorchestia longiramus]
MDATLSRSGSSLSVREEGEANAAEYEEGAADGRISAQLERQTTDTSVQQQNEAPQESFANWDPVNPVEVDWGDDEEVPPAAPPTEAPYDEQTAEPERQASPEQAGVKCIALYAYTSQNPDELSFMENEELELLGEGDGDGWVSARNYKGEVSVVWSAPQLQEGGKCCPVCTRNCKGEVGFIPQNYIEVEEGAALPPPPTDDVAAPAAAPTLTQNISFSSVDYDVQTTEDQDYVSDEGPPPPSDLPPEMPPPDMPPPPLPPTSIAITNGVEPKPPALSKIEHPNDGGDYCVALYDYEATCAEELTFEEGEVIKVLARAVHDVDDGWWMGELRGQQGLFPSLVVEECGMDGEPLTPEVRSSVVDLVA